VAPVKVLGYWIEVTSARHLRVPLFLLGSVRHKMFKSSVNLPSIILETTGAPRNVLRRE
jgi:hypothetical protein